MGAMQLTFHARVERQIDRGYFNNLLDAKEWQI
jgi:hypothetical protein